MFFFISIITLIFGIAKNDSLIFVASGLFAIAYTIELAVHKKYK